MNEEIDCFNQERCTCPYCGYVDEDSWEISEDATEIVCDRCELQFEIEQEITRTFTSIKIDPDEEP